MKDDSNADKRIKDQAILFEITEVFNRVQLKIKNLNSEATTNYAENYHSIRCKYNAHKFRNTVGGPNFTLRAHCAVL